ncbi:titin homolog [Argopecten irradians]|uniref:titin homolog n=1 Tax=Argopecten irradians TaxID=31199 RepID=UPI0037146DC2
MTFEMEHRKDRKPLVDVTEDSLTNDVIYVNPTDHDGPRFEQTMITSRDQRLKKRGTKKPTMTAEERNDQILQEAGIDTTGMSKQEKREFLKVIMMSRDDVLPSKPSHPVGSDGGNSSSQISREDDNLTPDTIGNDDNRIPDVNDNIDNPMPGINSGDDNFVPGPDTQCFGNEQSVGKSSHSGDKSYLKSTPEKTTPSQNKVGICQPFRSNTEDNGHPEKEDGWLCSHKEAQPVKDTVQKLKRVNGKRTAAQAKSIADDRSHKQRKMEQYAHIVIEEDDDTDDNEQFSNPTTFGKFLTRPNLSNHETGSGKLEQKKSPPSHSAMETKQRKPPLFRSDMETKQRKPPLSGSDMETKQRTSLSGSAMERDQRSPLSRSAMETKQRKSPLSPSAMEREQRKSPLSRNDMATEQRKSPLSGGNMTDDNDTQPPTMSDEMETSPPHGTSNNAQQIINSGDEHVTTKTENMSDEKADTSIPQETKSNLNFYKNKIEKFAHLVQGKVRWKSTKGENAAEESNLNCKDSTSSNDRDIEFFYDIPALERHYKSAKKVCIFQNLKQDNPKCPFYSPDPANVEWYAKVILQQLKLYSLMLTKAQSQAAEMVAWGEPVRCGRHMEQSLDIISVSRQKKNMVCSSEEEEFVPYKPRTIRIRKLGRPRGNQVNDPNYVPTHSSKDTIDTQPFGYDAETAVNDSQPVQSPDRRAQGDNVCVDETDKWMSAEKHKNQQQAQKQPNRRKLYSVIPTHSGMEVKTKAKGDGNRRTIYTDIPTHPGEEVKTKGDGNRRTIYTDIPTHPGKEVKTKAKGDVYNMSDENSGEEFLSLKRTGANYKTRRNRQRKLLQKSDSGGSVESVLSDDQNDCTEHSRKRQKETVSLPSPPYVQSESSLDSLSQQSAAMINAQGELYSTQVCLQRERSATKTRKNSGNAEGDTIVIKRQTKRKRKTSGPTLKAKKRTAQESNLDCHSDKSNISETQETQEYDYLPSVSETLREELPDLQNDFTQSNERITPTDSIVCNEETAYLEKRDSQSPNFKKRRGSRKVETVTRCEPDEQHTEITLNFPDTGDIPPQVFPQTSGDDGTKRPHHHDQEEIVQIKQTPIKLIPCPLCSVPFPTDQIEAHASECEGNQESPTVQNPVPVYPENGGLSDGQADGVMSFFKNSQSPTQATSPSPRKHRVKRADEEDTTGKAIEPESRLTIACYICDERLPVGQEHERHVEVCLKNAFQRQEEADAKGYGGARKQGKRSTRARIKEEQDKDDQGGNETEGYSSATEEEACTLRSLIRTRQENQEHALSSSSSSESYTDSSDEISPQIVSQSRKGLQMCGSTENQSWKGLQKCSSTENQLRKSLQNCSSTESQSFKGMQKYQSGQSIPGEWTLEELMNSPLKTFVPINAQNDSEGFENQFSKARLNFENRAQKKTKPRRKSTKKKRKSRKRKSTAKKPAAKRRKTNDSLPVHIR